MDVSIESKYLEQNKKYKYVESMDVLNASGISKVSTIQLVLKKDNSIIFNKLLKVYEGFKIYIDDVEKDIYQLTKEYFPLIGEHINNVSIKMNMDITGIHENKIQEIKIFTKNHEAIDDTNLVQQMCR